jgi:hypothetical protein
MGVYSMDRGMKKPPWGRLGGLVGFYIGCDTGRRVFTGLGTSADFTFWPMAPVVRVRAMVIAGRCFFMVVFFVN